MGHLESFCFLKIISIQIKVIHILTKAILIHTVIMSQVFVTIIAQTKTDTMDQKA